MTRLTHSLRVRLIAAFVAVTITALALSAGVFIVLTRDDQQQSELDRVASISPAIFNDLARAVFATQADEDGGSVRTTPPAFQGRAIRPGIRDVNGIDFGPLIKDEADAHDLRIFLIDGSGHVVEDSSGDLVGKQFTLPAEMANPVERAPSNRPYVSWQPADGSPGAGLTLVSPPATSFRIGQGGPAFAASGSADGVYSVLIGVPSSSLSNAWRALLPGLALAAGIALPVAILLAMAVARYITRPVQQLTVASRQLASGTFNVDVPSGRRDELGELSQAFQDMAGRVGESQAQMRMLIANISHDLKTPLTSILGFSRALQTGAASEPEDVTRAGGVIQEEAQRLASRLEDLLYLSELEAGQAVLEDEELDLGRLTEGVVARFHDAAAARELRISCVSAGEGPTTGDGRRIERAVENLIANAVKHAPPGGVIEVRVDISPPHAAIEVENDAPGLSEEELPRLFERFYRRERARGTAGGSGLGLPIARELFEAHGGSLNASLRGERLVLRGELTGTHSE